tara:strand:+ start:106 stop:1128 length:1023 start_codon:yes stop_codon:yes gene_type:complete
MRYPASEKLEIIRLVERSHLPAKQTLDRLGIARPTFYRWYDLYQRFGEDALVDKRPGPRRAWNRIPDDIHEQMLEMALERSELSPRELAVTFTDIKGYFVSEASVYRLRKAHDLITSPAFIVMKAASEFKDKTTAANQLWQTDFTYLKIVGWGWYYLSTILELQSILGEQSIPILPIASETPAAIFQLGSFQQVSDVLFGITWGAEDLPAAIGATTSRNEDGSYTAPYEMVRALTLFGAHAAGVAAIDTVFPDIKNLDGLARYARASARDGFAGMMAIHPAQIETMNAAFSPSLDEIALAQSIIDAFSNNPESGVLELAGKMIDKPHLDQARKILEKAGL